MKLLAPIKVRLFLCCWVIYTFHFATNVVREHYPAFSLVESFTLKVDRYKVFHPDIFEHRDGHAYIGNNVAASVFAAVPLLVFDPILDLVEDYEQAKLNDQGVTKTEYRTHHENSAIFLQLAKEAGLSYRFGASTVVTTAFLMAPLSAWLGVLMFQILLDRGGPRRKSAGLALVFAFGTPLFFRTGVLNHNVLMMHVTFLAFHLLWVRPEDGFPVTLRKRLAAGFLCGTGLALDYAGVIPLLVIYGYLVFNRLRTASFKVSFVESLAFVLASVPPVLYLLYSQWAMFGNPFMPGQYWMPDVSETAFDEAFRNPYSNMGFRGFTLPAPDLFFLNLFDPTFGMYTYGPLLMLGLIPAAIYKTDKLILPKPERVFVALYVAAFLAFCSANQYSRIQFNSGFRYMVPLVPVIFLAVSDHLVRMPRPWLYLLLVPVFIHSWVIAMVRESVPHSWNAVLENGPRLPWLHVLEATAPQGDALLGSVWLPLLVIAFLAIVVYVIWALGARAEAAQQGSTKAAPV